jgi:hypothetical protein
LLACITLLAHGKVSPICRTIHLTICLQLCTMMLWPGMCYGS